MRPLAGGGLGGVRIQGGAALRVGQFGQLLDYMLQGFETCLLLSERNVLDWSKSCTLHSIKMVDHKIIDYFNNPIMLGVAAGRTSRDADHSRHISVREEWGAGGGGEGVELGVGTEQGALRTPPAGLYRSSCISLRSFRYRRSACSSALCQFLLRSVDSY